MSKKREHVIALVNRRNVLIEELRAVDTELDLLLPDDIQPKVNLARVTLNGTSTIPKTPPNPDNLTEKIVDLLEANPQQTFTPAAVAQRLILKDKIGSIRSTLIRLRREERIDRPQLGVYRSKQLSLTVHDNDVPKVFSQESVLAERPANEVTE